MKGIKITYNEVKFDGINQVNVLHTRYYYDIEGLNISFEDGWAIFANKFGIFDSYSVESLVAVEAVE